MTNEELFIGLADVIKQATPVKHPSGSSYGDGFSDGEARHHSYITSVLADFLARRYPKFNYEGWIALVGERP